MKINHFEITAQLTKTRHFTINDFIAKLTGILVTS